MERKSSVAESIRNRAEHNSSCQTEVNLETRHTSHLSALHDARRKRKHFEELLGSQLVCGKAKDPGGDGLPGLVHQHAGVAIKLDGCAVLALILLLGLQDNGVVHLRGLRLALKTDSSGNAVFAAILTDPAETRPLPEDLTATLIRSPMVKTRPVWLMQAAVFAPELSATCSTVPLPIMR